MKKVMNKFGGAIFFYIAIIGMVLMVNHRFAKINVPSENDNTVALAE